MPKLYFKTVIVVLFVLLAAVPQLFCKEVSVSTLVDRYRSETDIQKSDILKDYSSDKIDISGVVSDVSSEDTFDVVNDVKRDYYKVVTEIENTDKGNPYRAILIYKNEDNVKNINKGDKITFSGSIIKVVDEKLYLSVWLTADDLTEKEKSLFK